MFGQIMIGLLKYSPEDIDLFISIILVLWFVSFRNEARLNFFQGLVWISQIFWRKSLIQVLFDLLASLFMRISFCLVKNSLGQKIIIFILFDFSFHYFIKFILVFVD